MKRNYSLFRIALVLATGGAFLLPASAPAPTVHITILQFYLGFSQSIRDPNVRGPAGLNVPTQTPEGHFQGFITILGNTYTITGEVDDSGNLEFNSGRVGPIKGTGKWQDLTRGGALIFGSYKLASGDQGKVTLLRKFSPPPEPDTPPDIACPWRGSIESVLSLKRETVEWMIQQDRTPSGAPGTGFRAQETVRGTINDLVGTIDGGGAATYVIFRSIAYFPEDVNSVSPPSGFAIGGGRFESGELNGTTVETTTGFDCSELVQWAAHHVD